MHFPRVIFRIALPGLIMMIISCSVEKNTSLSRNFHNLTSHFNVYFNGYESYNKGIERARETFRNDYTNILTLFYYEDEAVNTSVSSDMKRAIDKATKVITFHSITAKPKVKEGDQSPKDKAFFEKNEFNKWIDDSYMLMGMAYMYQGEYFLAVETFKHVMITFPKEEIRFLALTWLTRAYMMIGEINEAERILTALADESAFPEDFLETFYTTRADYHIKKEEYVLAAQYLESTLELKVIKKEEKIRYTYILAQLYEETEENELALQTYKKVTRFNPPYEMAFNAKVSMAEVYESGSSSSADLKKLLGKMLKDSKNVEYLDQIYFALGNIAMQEEEKELAIEYYALSVSSSVQNRYQKGYSSLTLAEIYYQEPDYILSAAYYDSAVTFLNQDYPDYSSLQMLSASLGGLVYNVNTYTLEDSLQMLAALPEAERLAIIDKIIEDVQKAEEEAKLSEQQAMQDMAFNNSMLNTNSGPSGTGIQAGGQWYFYNLNAKSFGQPEFRMKWGERTLSDDWRRRNKQSMSELMPGEGEAGDSINGEGGAQIFNNKSREFYLIYIPLNDSSLEQSHLRLEDALFNMGVIYKENLLDYPESINSFEELLSRYPEGKNTAPSLFHLHELNNSIQKPDQANYYKTLLASGYPDSHYAKLLINPNYIKELEEEEKKVVRFYETVYGQYLEKDYLSVIQDAGEAVILYPEDPLIPKFKLVRALSVGATGGKEAMKEELDSLIAQHPAGEESTLAREIIDYMYVAFPVIKEADEAKEAEVIFTDFDPEQEHYFIIALDAGENVNQVSFDLLNYNLDNFNQYNLEIEQTSLSGAVNLIVVKSFLNREGAGRYMTVIDAERDTILVNIRPARYNMALISLDNYNILSSQKTYNPYYLFYLAHYKNEE